MDPNPFKVIGIGATFSPNLKANLFEAARLCLLLKAKLVIIHVGEESLDKKESFKTILDPFLKYGLVSETVFTPGDPSEVILRASASLRIDMLIIGALQRENLVNYYVGSIARKITRKAKCSVLLLINPSVDRIPCKHIVVNGLEDPKTEKTVRNAFYVAHQLGASKITVVEEIREQEIHVHIDDDNSLRKAAIAKEKLIKREDSRVQKIVAEVAPDDKKAITIESQPIFGKRGYSIGHYAEVVRADLLVMNAPNKTKFWDRLFPHDIEHILTELPTDVLIIR
ncbi:universal stress protein [Dokdonia sp. Hel_I_53]|uniref:universal stress protein n=1 Tax=Dokdonia sp. Hel_I_53 TaxID=1566287 RepID=UPI00119C29D9|nr:universal stress protein [Dokdonia sp. Hel_I_53]TVZ51075.1 universal stress protein family protein [Dokdonia sp. Hel_I_53]